MLRVLQIFNLPCSIGQVRFGQTLRAKVASYPFGSIVGAVWISMAPWGHASGFGQFEYAGLLPQLSFKNCWIGTCARRMRRFNVLGRWLGSKAISLTQDLPRTDVLESEVEHAVAKAPFSSRFCKCNALATVAHPFVFGVASLSQTAIILALLSGVLGLFPPVRWGLLDFMSACSSSASSSACSSSSSSSSSASSSSACSSSSSSSSSSRHPLASTASSHVQCSLPDLNHDHLRPVFPDGPQRRPSASSVPCHTSTDRKNVKQNVRKYVRKIVRKYVRKNVRKDVNICQKECQKFVRKNVRRYVRKNVRQNVKKYVWNNVRKSENMAERISDRTPERMSE